MVRTRVIAAIACCLASVSAPQTLQPPATTPQFRTGIDLVRIDVSVLDRDRRPIRGLTAGEFSVLEDGTPQEIVSFAEIAVPDPPVVRTAWMRDVAPDVRTNAAAADRLIMLLLDDGQVSFGPRMTATVKAIGRRVIDHLGPSDLAAVVFTKDNRGAQPFTSDRSRLLKAVDAFVPGAPFALPGQPVIVDRSHQYFDRASLETLRLVATSLAEAPDRRKAVIYVSSGVRVGADQFRQMDFEDILASAGGSNVNVYCIDPNGLEAVADEAFGAAGGTSPDAALLAKPTEFLRQLAAATGGFAIVDQNGFAEGVTQIFRETGSYYLLGYRAAGSKRGQRFRKIDVRVSRPGATVRARAGYTQPTEPTRAKWPPREASLLKTLAAVVPERGVPMQITAAPFAVPGRKTAALAIVLTLRQPLQRGVTHVADLADVVVGAYGVEGGRPVAFQRLKTDAEVRALGNVPLEYELLSQLDLKPGRYHLRVAAISPGEAKSGSVHIDVEVPDFAKRPLSLSGIVVAVTPSTLAAPKDRFAALLPIVPTAQRDFRRGDRASAFLRVYQGGKGAPKPVLMDARILNGAGKAAFHITEAVTPEQFGAARSADYAIHLPIAQLAAGPYLLSLEATVDRDTARRDLRFTIH